MTALLTYFYIVVDTQRGCNTLKKGMNLSNIFTSQRCILFSSKFYQKDDRTMRLTFYSCSPVNRAAPPWPKCALLKYHLLMSCTLINWMKGVNVIIVSSVS